MKSSCALSLVFVVLSLLETSNAVPAKHSIARPRIGGSETVATALHTVLVIVIRDDHDDNWGAFGCGSIVTRNRVITAAHVVANHVEVQVGFYLRSVEASNFRRADPVFVQTFEGFDPETLFRDIAVLQFRGTPFAAANVIPLTTARTPTGDANLASFGFNSATATRPSVLPLVAAHTIEATCDEELAATETHFCAIATEAFVCPGDNGGGLYVTDADGALSLIGVVSTIREECVAAAQSAFTDLGEASVRGFLESQSIPVEPVDLGA